MAIAAVGQICSNACMRSNLKQCQILVQKAVAAGAKALFLPEASDYIASSADESVALAETIEDNAFVQGLRLEARNSNLQINVGIHEKAAGGSKVHNSLIWINENGDIIQNYRKLHLFDVDIKDGATIMESRYEWSTERGREILPPFETAVGRVGLTICFDLRFPEISLALKRLSADVITYPSAFTVKTGKAHWEPLLRARAIETQAYVIAAAQVGYHNEKRVSYGHSMIIDPWGEVLAELGGEDKGPEIATAEIDLDVVKRVKTEMPLNRRTDVYPEL